MGRGETAMITLEEAKGRFEEWRTCYRAADWKLLGLTTGRGKNSTSKRPNRSIKLKRCWAIR